MSDRYITATRPPLMRAALAWAERGWHVFPCAPGAKPPALRDVDWREIATTDRGQIGRWWTERPYNIGIDCGKSGLAVIDLDVPGHGKHGTGETARRATGLDALLRLSADHGRPAPDPTFTVSTPSGGYHLYYTAAETPVGSSTGRLGPLIDVRGAGGYVIAPGSRIGGRTYTVLNLVNSIPLAPMPSWLADLHETPAPLPDVSSKGLIPIQHGSAYAQAALRNEGAAVTAAARYPDAALNRAAYKLGQLAATGLLTEAEIRDELTAAAAATGMSEREIIRTIDRGLAAGERTPRQLPSRVQPPELRIPRERDHGRLTPRL